MSIFTRIRELRLAKGLTMEELAQKVGYGGRSAIAKVENGERQISHEMLMKYADVLDVSPLWLLYGDDAPRGELRPIKSKRFPMLGKIACGEPIYSCEEHESYVDAVDDIDADFCLTAQGNSMIGARIQDGDVVFIKKQPTVRNGEIAAVAIGDEFTLKYWYYYPEKNKLVLNPSNPAYEPLVFTDAELDTVYCLGKAVCFMSKF